MLRVSGSRKFMRHIIRVGSGKGFVSTALNELTSAPLFHFSVKKLNVILNEVKDLVMARSFTSFRMTFNFLTCYWNWKGSILG